MTINWEKEASLVFMLEIGNALLSHLGYAAIAAAAALFKLAIAATLVSYGAFFCATLLGGLVMYFPTRALIWTLENFELKDALIHIISFALQFGLSPMIGAYILNLALGLSLPLVPLLAVSSAGLGIGVVLLFTVNVCGYLGNHSNQLSSARQGYRSNALFAAPCVEKNNENTELVLEAGLGKP